MTLAEYIKDTIQLFNQADDALKDYAEGVFMTELFIADFLEQLNFDKSDELAREILRMNLRNDIETVTAGLILKNLQENELIHLSDFIDQSNKIDPARTPNSIVIEFGSKFPRIEPNVRAGLAEFLKKFRHNFNDQK